MPNGNDPRALVVDDVADAADILTMLLSMWGYNTKVCYGGVAALELARTHRPQVVLLDIGMPGTDGFKVARGLREMPGLEDTVLIGISGYTDEACRARALDSGFDHYLVKPEEPAHLKMLLSLCVRPTPSQNPGEPQRRASADRRYCTREKLSSYKELWLSAANETVLAMAPSSGRCLLRAGTAGRANAESLPGIDGVRVNEEVGSMNQV
jgi:CheY-like chemotaxis protein